MLLDEYHYELPLELIAHEPISPRDAARLLVYHVADNRVELACVRDLPRLLPGSQFVINDTRVLPARINAVGHEGKPVELLVLVDQGFADGVVRALVNRYTPIGETLHIQGGDGTFVVVENHEKCMKLRFDGTEAELRTLLEAIGQTPLPPYIHSEETESVRRAQYQTVFANKAPSVAAPTASLHFTPDLLDRLQAAGVTMSPLTLQVGLGTFAPIFAENFSARTLHTEFYSIPPATAKAIREAKATEVPVVAVGTTVVRALESAKEAVLKGEGAVASTDIFIFPPYQFAVPDVLLTNFHVPRSSLMCLVDAFLQHKGSQRSLLDLYHVAIAERFRFYSFGDAMLIL